MSEFAKQFAEHERAVVVAPAGCGKTELIVDAVANCSSRQLLLTHTNAGVSSLRKRLKKKKIASSKYHLETISSFAIRLALAYPASSGFSVQQPSTNEEYKAAVVGATQLMGSRVIQFVLQESYGGVFVDEYQDCSVEQHDLVRALVELIPCRLVGDHLQGIFGFKDTVLVDWHTQVFPEFKRLEDLDVPWRWKSDGAKFELGRWLIETARPALENGQPLSFQGLEAIGVYWRPLSPSYSGDLQKLATKHSEVFVICNPQNTNKPHSIAEKLRTLYKTIEPLTGEELYEKGRAIQDSNGQERLKVVLDLADMCLTGIKADCEEVSSNSGKPYRADRKIVLKTLFDKIRSSNGYASICDLYSFLSDYDPKPTCKRWQLWGEMKRALAISVSEGKALEDACWEVRTQSRFMAYRIPNKCISRTVLLKGLECDCAVVVDADEFTPKDLYVALTRGSDELHIYSKQPFYPSVASPPCPKCGCDLVVRQNNTTGQSFWGCSAYPNCKGTAPFLVSN